MYTSNMEKQHINILINIVIICFFDLSVNYGFPMEELINKGGLNWGEPEPFALPIPVFEYGSIWWRTPAECKNEKLE